MQLWHGVAMMRGGFAALKRQRTQRVVRFCTECFDACRKVSAMPKGVCVLDYFFVAHDRQSFSDDDDP